MRVNQMRARQNQGIGRAGDETNTPASSVSDVSQGALR